MSKLPKHQRHQLGQRSGRWAILTAVKNEGERLHNQIKQMAPYIQDDFDLIISDAPSTDNSTNPEILKSLGVTALISLKEKGGLSSSWRLGFAFALDAGYEGVITMDGNNKDGPDALPRFASELANGWDYVQGSRFLSGGHHENTPLSRLFLIKAVHAPWISLICRQRFTDTTNGFRGFSRRFLGDTRVRILDYNFQNYESPFYLAWAACHYDFKCKEIPVTRVYPPDGTVPTKIVGLSRRWEMLKPLVMLSLNRWKQPVE